MRTHSITSASPRGRRQARSWARRTLTLAAFLAAGLGTTACVPTSKPGGDVTVGLAFDPAPRVGATTCMVSLAGSDGARLRGAKVEIEGNMNHAGMVPVFGVAQEVEPGRYDAALEFTMAGDWFVIVRAELADGRSLEEVVAVPDVALPERDRAKPQGE